MSRHWTEHPADAPHGVLPRPPASLALLLATVADSEFCNRREDIARLAAGTADWNEVTALAQRHHVLSPFYLALERAAPPGLPAEIRTMLKEHFAANLKRNFLLARHAISVLQEFTRAGLRVLPYKGVFLAQSLYGHLHSREVHDIDLLVDPADAQPACGLLESAGYVPVERLDQEQVFRRRAPPIEIDLHWQVAPDFFAVDYDFADWWRRSRPATLGGQAYREPADADLLVLLCIQLAKDCWERRQRLPQLQKVSDLAELIRRRPDIDWPGLEARAERQGIARVLHFGLSLASGLLAAPVPHEVAAHIAADQTALGLARQVSDPADLAAREAPPERNELFDIGLRLRQLLFYLRLRERPRDKWRHVLRVMGAVPSALRGSSA